MSGSQRRKEQQLRIRWMFGCPKCRGHKFRADKFSEPILNGKIQLTFTCPCGHKESGRRDAFTYNGNDAMNEDKGDHAMLPFEVELWNRACDARDRVNAGGHVMNVDIDTLLGWAIAAQEDKSPRSDAVLAAARRIRRSLPGDIWHVDEYWKSKGGRKDIHRGPAKVFGPLPDLALLVVAIERGDVPSLCTIKAIEARLLNESDRQKKVSKGRGKKE